MREPQIVNVGEHSIHTEVYLPQEVVQKHPLVLVHGSWGGTWMWMHYIAFFVGKGWPVYALDLRGHGKSGGSVEGATMQDYVDDVRAVIAELTIENPIVVGHSMGGLVILMYGAQHGTAGLVAIDPSPSIEIQKERKEVTYPTTYRPTDAGMPDDPQTAMQMLPDVPQEMLMKMQGMLGVESGVARSERKKGISVPRESFSAPMLFVAGELSDSVPFGIPKEKTKAMADYYGGEYVEIAGATHPGILAGEHASKGARAVHEWAQTLGSL